MSLPTKEQWPSWVHRYVDITASDNSHFIGRVFSFSGEWNTLVVQCDTRVLHQQATFHIINVDQISAIVEVPDVPKSKDEALHVRSVDIAKLRQREATAIKKETQKASKINASISREAQLLFNEIDRTLPCRWNGATIVVLEDIEIVAPYGKEQVQLRAGSQGHAHSLNRVKQIVETYYSRRK